MGCHEDPYRNSPLLGDVFSFQVSVQRSRKEPSMAIIQENSYEMSMKDTFLLRADFFEQLSSVLPDFLMPAKKSRRAVLPVAYWKFLWDTDPPTFEVLEHLLARTIEQALWALASNPPFVDQPCGQPNEFQSDCILDEDWMNDDTAPTKPAKTKKTAKKKAKNKNKDKHTIIKADSSC